MAFAIVILLLCVLSAESITTNLPSLHDRIYHTIDTFFPCFRLTNATHQIGCSASPGSKSGVVQYVANTTQLLWLVNSGVHPPYIALLEPAMFTSTNVLLLKSSPKVRGAIVLYDNVSGQLPLGKLRAYNGCFSGFDIYVASSSSYTGLDSFSPEPISPNCGFGIDSGSCGEWNSVVSGIDSEQLGSSHVFSQGTGLSRMDFGDFPISAVTPDGFNYLYTQCYVKYNLNAVRGTSDEYPLCAAEMVADMYAVTNTETCFRRNSLPIFYLNDEVMCQPLGDNNVWSSLFDLPPKPKDIIMIATKLDSTAFFPYLSFGANNEVAGIATLMAIADALGQQKKQNTLIGTGRPVIFALFHGESWDYIGSSRMVYDMVNGVFPYTKDNSKEQPPMFNVSDITDFLELSHVGMPRGNDQYSYFVHPSSTNANNSDLMNALKTFNLFGNISLQYSNATTLPPASLQRFLKVKRSLNGIVISDYDTQFNNRFFGSRFDNLQNLVGTGNLSENSSVVQALTSLATLIANAVYNISQPNSNGNIGNISANSTLVMSVLECFLKNTSCPLFQTILHPNLAAKLQPIPLSRYITVATVSNTETKLAFQLLSYLTGIINTNTTCSACLDTFNASVQTYNVTWMQGANYNTSLDNCWCVKSYTHYHLARSPAFDLQQYTSTEYSTWAESTWKSTTLRVYLVSYTILEVGLLLFGVAITAASLGLGLLCNFKGRKIFENKGVAHANN